MQIKAMVTATLFCLYAFNITTQFNFTKIGSIELSGPGVEGKHH